MAGFCSRQKRGVMERQAFLSKHCRCEAAHSLPGHRSKCARVHGHSYQLEVTLRGPIKRLPDASDDGMVMDFADLSGLVQQAALNQLDHQDLNRVTGMRRIWGALLHCICLWETAQCRVEITAAERAGEDRDARDRGLSFDPGREDVDGCAHDPGPLLRLQRALLLVRTREWQLARPFPAGSGR